MGGTDSNVWIRKDELDRIFEKENEGMGRK